MATNLAPKMLRQVSFQDIDVTLNSELQVSLGYREKLSQKETYKKYGLDRCLSRVLA